MGGREGRKKCPSRLKENVEGLTCEMRGHQKGILDDNKVTYIGSGEEIALTQDSREALAEPKRPGAKSLNTLSMSLVLESQGRGGTRGEKKEHNERRERYRVESRSRTHVKKKIHLKNEGAWKTFGHSGKLEKSGGGKGRDFKENRIRIKSNRN